VFIACFAWFCYLQGYGQTQSLYVSLNQSDNKMIHKIYNNTVSLHFDDFKGVSDKLTLKIYNWKKELVYSTITDRFKGSNFYDIHLDQINSEWPLNEVFTLKVIDGNRSLYKVLFQKLVWVNVATLNVTSNPVTVQCTSDGLNLIDFSAFVTGARSPYKIKWYLIDIQKTKILQVAEQTVTNNSQSSIIQISRAPSYYLIVHVTDDCGNDVHKEVLVQCVAGQNSVNSLLLSNFNELIKLPQGQ
jgi:hypothetical protein